MQYRFDTLKKGNKFHIRGKFSKTCPIDLNAILCLELNLYLNLPLEIITFHVSFMKKNKCSCIFRNNKNIGSCCNYYKKKWSFTWSCFQTLQICNLYLNWPPLIFRRVVKNISTFSIHFLTFVLRMIACHVFVFLSEFQNPPVLSI